ncbi:prion-inhibition and propagation-domain-containing protein [Trichophaea hybrida]|nr:prion-inhibition and propagation-domain-containing protein [Trichophaea hybrida]
MEFAGLAMGGIGLVGALTSSLEIFDRISSAKAYGKEYELFISLLELERARLQIWGRDGMHERLADPIIQQNVGEILGWLQDTLERAEAVKKRYGLQHHGQRESSNIMSVGKFTTGIIVSSPARRMSDTHGRASTLKKLRWSVSGQKKALKLMNELRGFINKLYEFVPIAVGVEATIRINVPLNSAAQPAAPQLHEILEPLQLSQICPPQEPQHFVGTTFRRRPAHQRSVRLGSRKLRSDKPANRWIGVTKGGVYKYETSTAHRPEI